MPIHDASLSQTITALLRSQYGFTGLGDLKVTSFAGANIASQNLSVTTGGGRYFLKSRSWDNADKLDSESSLATRLRQAGAPVPQVILTQAGGYSCLHEERCWSLSRFEEGNYFTGKDSELDSAAATFTKLSFVSTKLPDAFAVQPVENVFLRELAPLLEDAATMGEVNAAVSELVAGYGELILAHLRTATANSELIESAILPVHLDYHPLNLLMRNGEVGCVVDLEHFKSYPVLAGLGFAAYKLIRQALVSAELRTQEEQGAMMVARWLEAWRSGFPELRFGPQQLGMGASYRVLWLIHFILNAAIRQSDHRFDYDLEKQIISLYEIEVIFGKLNVGQ